MLSALAGVKRFPTLRMGCGNHALRARGGETVAIDPYAPLRDMFSAFAVVKRSNLYNEYQQQDVLRTRGGETEISPQELAVKVCSPHSRG